MGKCVANNSLAIKLWSHGRAQRHLKQCQKSHCSKCWWASKGRKWKIFFPWLRFGERLEHRPGHGFRCSVCARFQHLKRTGFVLPAAQGRPIATPCRAVQEAQFDTGKTDFDNFTVEIKLKAFHLKRHQASQKHRQAVAFLEGFISEEDLSLAPSVDECRATLEAMRKGHSSRNGGSCSDRVNFLRWCLSESLLGLWRRELAASRTLCLIRDERKGKLLLRFRGCSGQLALCWLCAHDGRKRRRHSDGHCQSNACILHALFSTTSLRESARRPGRFRQAAVCPSEEDYSDFDN